MSNAALSTWFLQKNSEIEVAVKKFRLPPVVFSENYKSDKIKPAK